jgi:hypothetical protein
MVDIRACRNTSCFAFGINSLRSPLRDAVDHRRTRAKNRTTKSCLSFDGHHCFLFLPLMTATAPPAAQSTAPLPKPAVVPLFDFLKRKRWADLLMAELYDTMGFVVTPSTKVIYCRCAGMGDQFGWSDNDFIDCELTDFISRWSFISVILFRRY